VNRGEKVAEVEYLRGQFKNAQNAFLVGFSTLTVLQIGELRRQVRATSSSYRVVKNRLARHALEGTPLAPLEDEFRSSTAVAYNDNDPVALAKVLADFAKEHPALVVRVGLIEGKTVLDKAGVEALAKLPGMQELRGQLAALLATPATQLVRLLSTPGTQLARVLDARGSKLSESAG
jgi:large subunit ribosomal protein L10